MAEIISGLYRVDDETGEVLGLVSPPPFQANTLPGVEWVLEKLSTAQAERLALAARKAAIVANIDRQIKVLDNQEKYLMGRFEADLKAFTETETEGKAKRHVDTAFGRLRFMKTVGKIEIKDAENALIYCLLAEPEAVKTTQTVQVSLLKGKEDTLPEDAFTVTPPRDLFRIETGIK